ncbi:hypothetical protein D3C85_408920 [compost metagenome]
MIKRPSTQKSSKTPKRSSLILVALLLTAITVSSLIYIPIKTVRVGECPGRTIRLSLLDNGQEQINQAEMNEKKRVEDKNEILKRNPGLAMGCVPGKTYKLYIF